MTPLTFCFGSNKILSLAIIGEEKALAFCFFFFSNYSVSSLIYLSIFSEKLKEQEDRLAELDENLRQLRQHDVEVNEELDDLEEEKKTLEDKLQSLQDQKQNITKASPVGKELILRKVFVAFYRPVWVPIKKKLGS